MYPYGIVLPSVLVKQSQGLAESLSTDGVHHRSQVSSLVSLSQRTLPGHGACHRVIAYAGARTRSEGKVKRGRSRQRS